MNCGGKGRSGGLALLRKAEVNVSILSYFNFHIDAMVENTPSFRLTLFYGNPRVDRRMKSWDLLRTLNKRSDGPWMVFNDFNEILYLSEMQGERLQNGYQMRNFRNALMDYRLLDLGCKNNRFTY